jgi:hypothetical protein
MSDSKARFEAWYRGKYRLVYLVWMDEFGEYEHEAEETAWQAWQAAQATPPASVEPVAWMHVMDNTDGIEGNCGLVRLTESPANPFGVAGVDYDTAYPVTTTPLYTTPPAKPENPSIARLETQRLQKIVDYDALRQSPRQCSIEETENALDLCMWQAVLIDELDAMIGSAK